MSVSSVMEEMTVPIGQLRIRLLNGWNVNVTDGGTYSVPLPSAGWYSILVGPSEILRPDISTEKYAIN